jgi:hypothetical protein
MARAEGMAQVESTSLGVQGLSSNLRKETLLLSYFRLIFINLGIIIEHYL